MVIPPQDRGRLKWNFLVLEEIYMKKSRFTDSQIMEALKRAEAGLAVMSLLLQIRFTSPRPF